MSEGELTVHNVFAQQAQYCQELGSPFTARLCRLLAQRLDASNGVGGVVMSWPGDISPGGDSVPLRLCGALNYLAITGRNQKLADHYPPVFDHENLSDDALWELLQNAMERQGEAIIAFMASPPQTNEVRRSCVLIAAYHEIANRFGLPLAIYEVGASAGLNLHAHQYGLNAGKTTITPVNAPLFLTPQWQGDLPVVSDVSVNSLSGCDLSPVRVENDDDATRLLAYVWPDQIERVELILAAIEKVRGSAVSVQKADAIEWLEKQFQTRPRDEVMVVQHTIAWQYFSKTAKADGEKLFAQYGAMASRQNPIARISMENDGKGPGARLQLTCWPEGKVHELGRADFHGRWVNWKRPGF